MILEKIANSTRSRIEAQKRRQDPRALIAKASALEPNTGFPFEKALSAPGLSVICEVKRASPSAGIIAEDFPYLEIASAYADAGADAISVLTEPDYFKGHATYLREIASDIPLPTLRKDFVVDPFQIYEAKMLGAAAVLLICAILNDAQLQAFVDLAHRLGLSALVEAHDETETHRAVLAGARVIGVNNRDLRTFEVDMDVSARLRKFVPPDILFVSESGIRDAEDARRLKTLDVDAILVGESLMRASDKSTLLGALKNA